MCNPAIAIGLATGLMSGLQSVAGYQAERQAAIVSERAYQQNRNAALQQRNIEDQKAQLKAKGEREKADQEAEQGLVRRLQAQGTTLAAGRTGQSIGGLLSDAERVEGKDLGALGMNLAYAQQDLYFNLESNFLSAKSTINQAASQRKAKPSGASLALGLGGAALSGVTTFKEMGGDFKNPFAKG